MADPVEELERLVALPEVRVIRVQGPPAAGKSTLIRLVKDRGMRVFHMNADFMRYPRFGQLTIGIFSSMNWSDIPVGTHAVVAEYNLESHKHLDLEEFEGRARDVKVIIGVRRRAKKELRVFRDLKIILHGRQFDSKPDIVIPGGGWSRQIHPGLPPISKRWFYQVFLLLLLKGLPTEMVELVLTRLYGWQIDLYKTYAMRLGKRTLKVDLTHTLCPPRGAA